MAKLLRRSKASTGWLLGGLFGGDGDLDPVELGRADELAGEPRVRLDADGHVEHVDLGFRALEEFLEPAVGHVDLAGRAGAGATALRCNVEARIAQDLHHRPAIAAFEFVHLAFAVGRDDLQETPSFFCRLDDEVVYWKRSFSFGLQMWKAACAISAASWKPESISFSLPG